MRMTARIGLAALCALAGAVTPAMAQEKQKVFLSMSYIGNDWQAEAANMVKAMAASKTLRDKIDLEVQVAAPMPSARSSRSTPWCRPAPRLSWSTRSPPPR